MTPSHTTDEGSPLSDLGQRLLDASYLEGDFLLRSGRRSKFYLDKYLFSTQPDLLRDIAAGLAQKLPAYEPFDILANTSWLPAPLTERWETCWTPPRCQKVIDAALKYGVALEISSSYKLPKLPFLKLAKAAGAKFSFGSNGRYPKMGLLDYSIAMAKELGLTRADMFMPAPEGQKAEQRWKRG